MLRTLAVVLMVLVLAGCSMFGGGAGQTLPPANASPQSVLPIASRSPSYAEQRARGNDMGTGSRQSAAGSDPGATPVLPAVCCPLSARPALDRTPRAA